MLLLAQETGRIRNGSHGVLTSMLTDMGGRAKSVIERWTRCATRSARTNLPNDSETLLLLS